jgi:hypothetical protein
MSKVYEGISFVNGFYLENISFRGYHEYAVYIYIVMQMIRI